MIHVAIVSSDPRVEELLKPSGLTMERFARESWSPASLKAAPGGAAARRAGTAAAPRGIDPLPSRLPETPVVLITSSLDRPADARSDARRRHPNASSNR